MFLFSAWKWSWFGVHAARSSTGFENDSISTGEQNQGARRHDSNRENPVVSEPALFEGDQGSFQTENVLSKGKLCKFSISESNSFKWIINIVDLICILDSQTKIFLWEISDHCQGENGTQVWDKMADHRGRVLGCHSKKCLRSVVQHA